MKLFNKLSRKVLAGTLLAGVLLFAAQGPAAAAENSSQPVPANAPASGGRLPQYGEVLRGVEIPPDTTLPLASRWYYETQDDKGYEYTRVRPLDDPANPYLGQYEDWDRWFYGNYFAPNWGGIEFEPLKQARIAQQGGSAEQWGDYYSFVSPEGWLIPQCQTWRFYTEVVPGTTLAGHQSIPYGRADAQVKFWFHSAGCMPEELAQRRQHEEALAMAVDYPPIPAWLGENPPQEALTTLEGDWLCLGPLGGSVSLEDWPSDMLSKYGGLRREPSYLYKPDGRVIGQAPMIGMPSSPIDFAALYGEEAIARRLGTISEQDDGTEPNIYAFWWTGYGNFPEPELARSEPMVLEWARDYRGNPIDINAPLSRYHNTTCMPIGAPQLAAIYQAQLELGLTDSTPSPFAGTAEGPVVSGDSKSRPRTRWAVGTESPPRGHFGSPPPRPVRSINSPGNPYANEYGAIDGWIWEHEGWENPKQSNAISLTGDSLQLGVEPSATPGWQQLRTRVDKDGYAMPLALALQLEHEALYGTPEQRQSANARLADSMYMHSGGVLDPELQEQLSTSLWPALASYYPQIPDWLGQQPVQSALIMPDGQVVTYGELGSWEDETATAALPILPSVGQGYGMAAGRARTVNRRLCRYSASGELLGSLPLSRGQSPDSLPWQALFEPGLMQVADSARSLGQAVYSQGQYMAVQDRNDVGTTQFYDLTGAPVDPEQLAQAAQTRWLDWADIQAVWKLQQAFPQ